MRGLGRVAVLARKGHAATIPEIPEVADRLATGIVRTGRADVRRK
jgi:hypothetical protein